MYFITLHEVRFWYILIFKRDSALINSQLFSFGLFFPKITLFIFSFFDIFLEMLWLLPKKSPMSPLMFFGPLMSPLSFMSCCHLLISRCKTLLHVAAPLMSCYYPDVPFSAFLMSHVQHFRCLDAALLVSIVSLLTSYCKTWCLPLQPFLCPVITLPCPIFLLLLLYAWK